MQRKETLRSVILSSFFENSLNILLCDDILFIEFILTICKILIRIILSLSGRSYECDDSGSAKRVGSRVAAAASIQTRPTDGHAPVSSHHVSHRLPSRSTWPRHALHQTPYEARHRGSPRQKKRGALLLS